MRAVFLLAMVSAGVLWDARAAGFPGPFVWPVRIEVTEENATKLRAKPREYVPATVRIMDEAVTGALVRLKGRGSFQAFDQKPSFTIDFEKVQQTSRPQGLEKIHLNNSVEDASYLKERIGSEIFEGAGIPAPRVGHARVTLNGRMLGLYVLKEGFTADFVHRNFKHGDANLYDTDEGTDVDGKMELEVGVSRDQDELKRLAAAAKDPDLERRWSRLAAALDERFFTFMATEIMIGHWDGYCLSRNNFRVLYDARRDKVLFLPAGMDQIFAKADASWKPAMAGLVASSVLETGEGRQRYEATFRRLFDTQFETSQMTNRIAELAASLRPFLEPTERSGIESEARELCEKIARREIDLRRQLAEGEPELPRFVNGIAPLSGWKPFDSPEGGRMDAVNDGGELRIVAGPKTAASWRTTVHLKPGRYRFSAKVQTANVQPLAFGGRHGASLRVMGGAARSESVIGTVRQRELGCFLDVAEEREVVVACELRASRGEAMFEGLILRQEE